MNQYELIVRTMMRLLEFLSYQYHCFIELAVSGCELQYSHICCIGEPSSLWAVGDRTRHHILRLPRGKTLNEPCHVIMVLFVLRKLILQTACAQPSSGARCLIFGRTLRLLPYFMCANSEGSGETARMRRLV